MREIKFRIWDDAPTKDGFPGLMIDMNYAMSSTYLVDAINGKYPLMQYTGLKDKNGKEIYEGDIIKMTSYNYQHLNNEKWEVVYSGEDMRFQFKKISNISNGRTAYEDRVGWHSFEIIGNIYETPSLLTQ